MSINADDVLNANDLEVEKLHINEWKKDIYIRVMNGDEREKWEKVVSIEPMPTNIRAIFATMVCCQENGDRLFNDDHAAKLNSKSSKALLRIWDAGLKLNKIGKTVLDAETKN